MPVTRSSDSITNRNASMIRMAQRRRALLALGGVLLATSLLVACRAPQAPSLPGRDAATVQPWPTPVSAQLSPTPADARALDPLVPTPPAAAAPSSPLTPSLAFPATVDGSPAGQTAVTATLASPATSAVVTSTAPAAGVVLEPGNSLSRLGVGVPLKVADFEFDAAMAGQLGMGWYLDWHIDATPVITGELEYAQLYAMRNDNIPLRRDRIAEVLAANPGALWLAGNEPDVIWQDNQTPEQYAQLYHQFYTFVKTLDPSAQVAIAGVSQVTPLRLQYLEEVLAAYQRLYGRKMPVDVWNVHAFILREERDSWGVSIPPGLDVDQGTLWEIEDHDNLDIFRQQIVDFRRWMAANGERDKPLIVSEYGILMPGEYGFPPEQVASFMTETFDFLLNAADPEIGYPADGNRLVQRLTWYSLSDTVYPTSNLVDPKTGELTLLGQTFAAYAARLAESQ
jgi:hypothetical protein